MLAPALSSSSMLYPTHSDTARTTFQTNIELVHELDGVGREGLSVCAIEEKKSDSVTRRKDAS